MSAKATGADPTPNGNAQHRQHSDGSETRAFTVEQKEAVIRVRKCSPTAFYDILGLETEKTTVTDGGIKKAYRKLSLLTHPDKNGYTGADEAFKMVSRAFQILSDPDKRRKFDQFGGDPDSRFSSASAAGASPFSGFARSPGARGAGRPMFEEEISPEELFRQFFAGGFGGGGGFGGPFGPGLFNAGPGFVFNAGGGPGIRIHQFGGNRPRRRPPGTGGEAEQPRSAFSVLLNMLPLIFFIALPLISNLLSSAPESLNFTPSTKLPAFSVDTPRQPDLTTERISQNLKIPYYYNPNDVVEWSETTRGHRKWQELDRAAENRLALQLSRECMYEANQQQELYNQAQGWFLVDLEKEKRARNMPMPACRRMDELRIRRPYQ